MAGTLTFNYDPADRLTSAAFSDGQSILHVYAPSGKLIQCQINPGPSPDSDTDGMTDAWEMFHFGTLARNGAGDFDGDGQNDVAEFFTGTLPNAPTHRSACSRLPASTAAARQSNGTLFRERRIASIQKFHERHRVDDCSR